MENAKNIIIYGSLGLSGNVGDQAMVFTLIDYLKKQKHTNIFLLNDEAFNNNDKYTFNIIKDIPIKFMLKDINKVLYLLYSIFKKNKKYDIENINKSIQIYKSSDVIFCINGFLITSQLEFLNSIGSFIKLIYAKKNNKKIIILPQSVGPFNYKGIKKIIFEYLFKISMKYPEKIFLRGKYGYQLYKERKIKNIAVEQDIVLSRDGDIDSNLIYNMKRESIDFSKYNIDKNKDMLLNINTRFLKYIPEKQLIEIYKEIILGYLNYSKGKVYIFKHDYICDKKITNLLYSKLQNNSNIIYIEDKLNCMEIEQLMTKFDIGLFSRWHAYVHSIRANLPSVILGWSEKYRETAKIFKMQSNLFDIREHNEVNEIIDALKRVQKSKVDIKNKLKIKHEEIKKTYILEREGKSWLK